MLSAVVGCVVCVWGWRSIELAAVLWAFVFAAGLTWTVFYGGPVLEKA